jgi:restriction system protein
MSPILLIAKDRKEHSVGEMTDHLAKSYGLTEEQRKERLPSGRQSKFTNRVGWALTHLKKAKVLEPTEKGKFQITDRGMKLLSDVPLGVDNKVLEQFPEFREFRQLERKEDWGIIANVPTGAVTGTITLAGITPLQGATTAISTFGIETPRESLERNYRSLRADLAGDLLERTKICSSDFFEDLVVELLVAMGYGGSIKEAGKAIGKTRDGGIDGLIKQDRLGLDNVYIQAKRWQGTVGSPELRDFVGSLEGHHASKGVFITTSKFSGDARKYLEKVNKTVVLIDGEQLVELMIEHGIGTTDDTTYRLKKLDLDYFSEEE